MRVYLANQFSKIEETRQFAKKFRAAGIEVTSSWLNEPNDEQDSLKSHHEDYLALLAKSDFFDIGISDAFVIFTVDPDQPTKRGGRHVETGLALAMGKKVIVCGPRENIFHHLPVVQRVDNVDEVIALLRDYPINSVGVNCS